jgi:glycosyltransferase 2 family protein
VQRALSLIALSFGLGLTLWLLSAANFKAVLSSIAEVGWGVLAVVLVRAATTVTNGVAWARLLPKSADVTPLVVILVRWIREAFDMLLPFAGISGGMAGARLLTLWRVSGAVAVASVAADLFLQTAAQVIFAVLGLLLLARVAGFEIISPIVMLGVAIAVISLGGFYVVQRYGGARLIDGIVVPLIARMAGGASASRAMFEDAIEAIWDGARRSILVSLLLHLTAWLIGTFEVWVIMYFMGRQISVENAVILESLGTSISVAAFFVPGSWGVQEGGYILLGRMLGLPAHIGLALSLIKRVPDWTLGIPGLIVWQGLEARHLLSRGEGT